ncbi:MULTISPECIES: hypothetical protein [Bacillaceae]|uniref:hypothetical protein n=1 Tax=Bacillaceae TaxID=186817 RepID=UPI002352F3E0|nr:hypothetical protein [Bacillus weihaiensis]
MLEAGMSVDVDSIFIKGSGVIVDVSNEPFYPIQVEMNTPDNDGHKFFRFHYGELKQSDKSQNIKEKVHQKVEVIEEVYGFKIGQQFTATPTRLNRGTHYYIYEGERPMGCFSIKYFKEIKVSNEVILKKDMTVEKKQQFIQKDTKKSKFEQTSIFDFL